MEVESRHLSAIGRRQLLKVGAAASLSSSGALAAASFASPAAMAAPLDIVDAQVHIGPDGIQPALGVMNALRISSALLYEHWGPNPDRDPRHNLPGYVLPGGSWRGVSAIATTAALLYPDRFASVVKVDPRDPQLKAVLETIASTPYIRGIRVLPVWTKADAAAFAAGGCDRLFAIAQDLRIPVFLFIPGHVAELAPYLRRFPKLTAIIDHCGMPFANIPMGAGTNSAPTQYFETVLKIARFENVALKWSHANDQFGVKNATPDDLRPYLRAAIDAFGANRVVWASDNTVIPSQTWSGLLRDVLDEASLSASERASLLGGAVRKLLRWDT